MGFMGLSIRARMTLAVTGLVLVLMLFTALGSLTFFERQQEKNLTEYQVAMLKLLADSIDSGIKVAQLALVNNAKSIPPEALNNPAQAQAWLESRTGLKTQFFTNHLVLFTPSGTVIAITPHLNGDSSQSLSVVNAVKETFAKGRPQISEPGTCCNDEHDMQIVFTAPVESKGRVVMVLAGTFSIIRPTFLSGLMQTKINGKGFVRIIDKNHRVIFHPDSKRIYQKAAPDLLAAIKSAFAENKVISIRHKGVNAQEIITSLQPLKSAGWVVASSYPLTELYAPIKTARLWFAGATVAAMVFAVLVVLQMMRLLTRPLSQLSEHLSTISEKKGDERFIHLPVNGEIGRLTGAFNGMLKEIDRSSEALARSEERYRLILEHSTDFIFWRRPDGGMEFVSQASTLVTGYSPDEFYADPSIMDRMVYPADRNIFEDSSGSRTVADFCGKREVEYRIIGKNGEIRWVRHACTSIYDDSGMFIGRRGSISDVSARKDLADQVSHLVMHDILTGLPNRSLFSDRLEVALSQGVREQKILVVMFFGIDRFKLINDTMGHEAGDGLLIMTAERLKHQLHTEDTLCRFGGDVFALMLPYRESRHEAVSMAYLILAALTEPFILGGGRKITLTGSIGIAISPMDGNKPETLLKNAEAAMYDAKKSGKNTFRFYTSKMNEFAAEMLALDNSMPASLANGDFYIHFQPQLDLKTDTVVGVEALLRWRHPELGFIGPDRFIPLAEESGFIIKLGEWVLRKACSFNAEWIRSGLPAMRVAVNISARQFLEPDFMDQVSAALNDSGLDPEHLEIELTESMLVADEEQTLKRLISLKNMGIQLAIDDFGTGYSSLSYLKHFPLDRLKIDKSFVNDILNDPDDAAHRVEMELSIAFVIVLPFCTLLAFAFLPGAMFVNVLLESTFE